MSTSQKGNNKFQLEQITIKKVKTLQYWILWPDGTAFKWHTICSIKIIESLNLLKWRKRMKRNMPYLAILSSFLLLSLGQVVLAEELAENPIDEQLRIEIENSKQEQGSTLSEEPIVVKFDPAAGGFYVSSAGENVTDAFISQVGEEKFVDLVLEGCEAFTKGTTSSENENVQFSFISKETDVQDAIVTAELLIKECSAVVASRKAVEEGRSAWSTRVQNPVPVRGFYN